MKLKRKTSCFLSHDLSSPNLSFHLGHRKSTEFKNISIMPFEQ